MSEYDYKPNSHAYKNKKQEEKKIEKVVKGNVKTKKKSEARKFTDVFISEDAHNVKNYIFMDVLVPAIKKAISDIVTDGIDMILYGGTGSSKKKRDGYTSYRSYSSSDRKDRDRFAYNKGFDLDDIIFESRVDAEDVREQMEEIIDNYGIVTVSDLYEMSDLPLPYTGNKYGWTSLRSSDIVRVRGGGYSIKLPRPKAID